MKKSLDLNFSSITNENIDKMLDELQQASPVTFTHSIGSPDMRDVLTKPEYLHVSMVVRLIFDSDSEARQFMSSKCREIYDSYSFDCDAVGDK